MHIAEAAMDFEWSMFVGTTYRDKRGAARRIQADDTLWNAGVIGLSSQNAELADDMLAAHDSLIAQGLPPDPAEQVAASLILGRHTDVIPASDVVYHYWGKDFRRRWEPILAQALFASRRDPYEDRIDFLYRYRPRLSSAQHARRLTKKPFQAFGLVRTGPRASHHCFAPALPRTTPRIS
jgi:hypothetical protein